MKRIAIAELKTTLKRRITIKYRFAREILFDPIEFPITVQTISEAPAVNPL